MDMRNPYHLHDVTTPISRLNTKPIGQHISEFCELKLRMLQCVIVLKSKYYERKEKKR